MKLILSSCDFRNENSKKIILENLGMPIDECRVLYLPDERASKKDIRSDKFYLRLGEFGFKRENIIIFDYYAPENFKNLQVDALYMSGGNTFQMMYRLRKHGVVDTVINYIRNGATYIGGSAGAHIVSANIEHILKYDKNVNEISDFSGLALFDGILICHYCKERQEHYEQLVKANKYKVYKLTNDDAIVLMNYQTKCNTF